ncbi:uncharacterized protein LOC112510191 isoform X2 [Cynara cardunculus var. scolymus]|uniref:uncharacterized protein LOC112510191 isoform X2 n=1 Tax=Cynara cardunculus var. scolymus TaxID=59895 RepID=UPI000D623D2F|nr:uncharacterized protein LOC112510191 isoform X2 [Cynara cardunculus var. scolymus]
MDPNTDLPPMTSDHVADASPPPSTHAHPPYAEMITAAITALKDKDGSSRQAISKYIEKEYTNLPPTHSVLLTHHLKRLKNQGELMMVKHSYMLPPRSVPFQPPTSTGYHPSLDFGGTSNVTDATATTAGVNAENSLGLLKRKPGRPPKLRPDSGFVVQDPLPNVRPFDADVPPYQPQFQYNVGVGQDFQTQTHLAPTGQDLHLHYGSGSDFQGNSGGGAEPLFASLGLGDDGVVVPSPPPTENTSVVAKRGRGRPPKVAGSCGFDVAGPGGDIAGSGGEIQARKTGSGRPVRKPKMMSVLMGTNGGRVKKGRGRPKRIDIGPVTVPLSGNVLRPRGRPKRAVGRPSLRPAQNVAVNGGISESGLPSRRSGRPSLSGGANNKLTGKPVGRPSKKIQLQIQKPNQKGFDKKQSYNFSQKHIRILLDAIEEKRRISSIMVEKHIFNRYWKYLQSFSEPLVMI